MIIGSHEGYAVTAASSPARSPSSRQTHFRQPDRIFIAVNGYILSMPIGEDRQTIRDPDVQYTPDDDFIGMPDFGVASPSLPSTGRKPEMHFPINSRRPCAVADQTQLIHRFASNSRRS